MLNNMTSYILMGAAGLFLLLLLLGSENNKAQEQCQRIYTEDTCLSTLK